MTSHSLAPHSTSFHLPVATVRSVYQTHVVQRKLNKLPHRDEVGPHDLPKAGSTKSKMGFVQ